MSKYVLIFLLRDNKPTLFIAYNTAHFSIQCGWYVLLPFFMYRDMNIRYKDVKFKFVTSYYFIPLSSNLDIVKWMHFHQLFNEMYGF